MKYVIIASNGAAMIPRRLRVREPLSRHIITVEQPITMQQAEQMRQQWHAVMGPRRRVVIVAGIGSSGSVREVRP